MIKKILILGINGFIGNQLTKKILTDTDWDVYGMDIADNKSGEVSSGSSIGESGHLIKAERR